MSKYLEYTTGGINIREKGPGQVDPILATITPDALLALIRPTSWEKTEAATPEPGGLDVEAELESLRRFHQLAIDEDPRIPRSTFSDFNATFRAGFRKYLRDLESRRKPAEPSGWPEATEADAKSIYNRALQLFRASRDGEFTIWSQIQRAIQEWLDSKPRPKPVVNSNGTPVADVSLWGPVVNIPSGFTATINDVDPFMTLTRNPPESVELTESQVLILSAIWENAAGLPIATIRINAALRKMGLGLHRLDPKPSAEPDPGEDDLDDRIEAGIEFIKGDLAVMADSVDKRLGLIVNGVGSLIAKLDAIAERLDGPKGEAVTLTDEQVDSLFTHLIHGTFPDVAPLIARQFDEWGLILIRKPLTKGDPS